MILTTDKLAGASIMLACDTSTGQELRAVLVVEPDSFCQFIFEARSSKNGLPIRTYVIGQAIREFNREQNKEAA